MTDPIQPTNATPAEDPNSVLFVDAYQQLLPQFQALAIDELIPVNIDVPQAVTTVLGVQPHITSLLPRVQEELPKFDTTQISKLAAYAMALGRAHTLFLMASEPPNALQSLMDEGSTLRETLLSDASTLARRKLVDGNRLKDLQGANGFKNVAFDLQILSTILQENWPSIQSKCATQPDELKRAEQVAAGILRAVGVREQNTAAIAATTDIRTRAFTAFVRVYDQARRAVTYLRWNENDEDTIAPSLYAGRNRGKKQQDPNTDVPPPAPPRAQTPANAPGTHPVSAEGTQPPAGTVVKPIPGTPGAGPFVNN